MYNLYFELVAKVLSSFFETFSMVEAKS